MSKYCFIFAYYRKVLQLLTYTGCWNKLVLTGLIIIITLLYSLVPERHFKQFLHKTFLFRTRVTKIQYLASSRGSLITPKSHTPPSTSAINDEFQKCCEKGQQHLATVFIQPLYHYIQGVRVIIDKPAKDINLDDVKRQLKSNYMSSLKGLYL